MHIRERFPPLVLVLALTMAVLLVIASPFMVQGAPPLEGEFTPRPTIDATATEVPTQAPPPSPTQLPTLPPTGSPTQSPTQSPTGSPAQPEPAASQLDIALIVDKAEAHPGDVLHYQIQVANDLGKEATNVWLTCDLSNGAQIQEVTTSRGEVHNYGQRISIDMGNLPANFESQFITILARIREDAKSGTEISHRANLTSDQAGGGERTVKTLVLGAEPAAAVPTVNTNVLPTTGSNSLPWWGVAIFAVLIAVAAWASTREHTRTAR